MKRKVMWTLCLATVLSLSLAALARVGDPANPTLTEKRFQATQLVGFFPVDLDLARRWVPPAWDLLVDGAGKATGVLALMDYPEYCLLSTPNSPPLEDGENVAPASIVHFWFVLQGPAETLPVPGAVTTNATAYYYDVADLVTSPLEHRVYRRSGRAAIRISDITLVDLGGTQTSEVTFLDGRKITIHAETPPGWTLFNKVGGNLWQWHVGGATEMGNDVGIRLDPVTGHPSNVNRTRGQYLGQVLRPATGQKTTMTIHADPGTLFVDCFGATDVVASRATVFKLNNIALNWGRGELLWTKSPPVPLPAPPVLP